MLMQNFGERNKEYYGIFESRRFRVLFSNTHTCFTYTANLKLSVLHSASLRAVFNAALSFASCSVENFSFIEQ